MTKDVQYQYILKLKPKKKIAKKIKEDRKKWISMPISNSRKPDIFKISIIPKLIYRFNIFTNKIPALFCEIFKLILKFIGKNKKTQNSQNYSAKQTINLENLYYLTSILI